MVDYVEAVRTHAVKHYNTDGWDYVVECWGDFDIHRVTENAPNLKAALALMLAEIKPLDEYRSEIQSTRW